MIRNKLTIILITLNSIAFSQVESNPDPLEPVQIFDGTRITTSEVKVKSMLIGHKSDDKIIYYDTIENITREFQFFENGNVIIETRIMDSYLHGFSYYKSKSYEIIRLYESDSLICESIRNMEGKILSELFRNGNMHVMRLYNRNGKIKTETVQYNSCTSISTYSNIKDTVQLKRRVFKNRDYCDINVINYYSYLNYPEMRWLKSFSGIDFLSLY